MSKEEPKIPEPFNPHPNLSDDINKNIIESEIAGGVWLEKMLVGERLRIETQNRIYTVEKRKDGFYMKGHPEYCPDWTKVNIHGSTWGGSMIKMKFIGNGMFLEFSVPDHPEWRQIRTSQIKEVTPVPPGEDEAFEFYEGQMGEK